jgi:hypothetical protein
MDGSVVNSPEKESIFNEIRKLKKTLDEPKDEIKLDIEALKTLEKIKKLDDMLTNKSQKNSVKEINKFYGYSFM